MKVVARADNFTSAKSQEARAFLATMRDGAFRQAACYSVRSSHLSAEHLWLVAIAVVVATAIAAPSAVFLTHHARTRRWTLGLVNIVQTIPSLAMFGFLLPLPFIGGVGKQTAILALILYALLPILRNTVVGITGVDSYVGNPLLRWG